MDVEESGKTVMQVWDTLVRSFGGSGRRMFSWPVPAGKALRTQRETRNRAAVLFARQSNGPYRNVSLGPYRRPGGILYEIGKIW